MRVGCFVVAVRALALGDGSEAMLLVDRPAPGQELRSGQSALAGVLPEVLHGRRLEFGG